MGSIVFLKESITTAGNAAGSVLGALKQGVIFLTQYSNTHEEAAAMVVDRDLFEDDIEQA